jgi:hypothetical protein
VGKRLFICLLTAVFALGGILFVIFKWQVLTFLEYLYPEYWKKIPKNNWRVIANIFGTLWIIISVLVFILAFIAEYK